jgi:hypothetical protein
MPDMAKKPQTLSYESPQHRKRSPTETPIRNQLVELVRSAWIILLAIGRFISEMLPWR